MISVIMPYYRKKQFLESAVLSVLSQSYRDFELIIIYDDNEKIDFEYVAKFKKIDSRIKIITNENNLGAGLSRNIGIKSSSGEYIAFLDSDDIWLKTKLEKQIKFMKEKNLDFSFTAYNLIDHLGNLVGERKAAEKLSYDDLIKSCDIGLSTVILKKKIIDENCQFVNLVTKEDYVLWLNVAKKNIEICGFNEKLTHWRKLNNSLSSNTFQKFFDGYKVYNKYMGYNKIYSFINLLRLSINYLLKR
tara:strand:+ start:112 stop:849 length:738 start_codon:yes stop_codon:yes gene_type:complete